MIDRVLEELLLHISRAYSSAAVVEYREQGDILFVNLQIDVGSSIQERVKRLVEVDDMVGAIDLYRKLTGADMRQARAYVEQFSDIVVAKGMLGGDGIDNEAIDRILRSIDGGLE